MFGRGPRNNGIDCGRSGLVVFDEDAPDELDQLCADHGQPLPVTFTVATGKGRHLYLRQPEGSPFTNSPGALRDRYRIDVRGRGGYVVGPGSQHATGRRYQVLLAAPIAPVPGWIAELLRPPTATRRSSSGPAVVGGRDALAGLLRIVLEAPVGQRNTALNWAAYRMYQKVTAGYVTDAAAAAMLLDAATAVGLPEGEARRTIASARTAVLGA